MKQYVPDFIKLREQSWVRIGYGLLIAAVLLVGESVAAIDVEPPGLVMFGAVAGLAVMAVGWVLLSALEGWPSGPASDTLSEPDLISRFRILVVNTNVSVTVISIVFVVRIIHNQFVGHHSGIDSFDLEILYILIMFCISVLRVARPYHPSPFKHLNFAETFEEHEFIRSSRMKTMAMCYPLLSVLLLLEVGLVVFAPSWALKAGPVLLWVGLFTPGAALSYFLRDKAGRASV